MRVVFDTTGIVDVDRGLEPTVTLLETLVVEGADLFVSTVTVAEAVAGVHLHEDPETAMGTARRVLGQFNWVDVDGEVAQITGELLALLHGAGDRVGFQDAAIAATHSVVGADALVTSNVDHFQRFGEIRDDVHTPDELLSVLDGDA